MENFIYVKSNGSIELHIGKQHIVYLHSMSKAVNYLRAANIDVPMENIIAE
ncbi:MAG: hypothetical protein SNG97_07050 [Rikenellaceae bacterium]